MIVEIGYWGSFLAGLALLIMCGLGLRGFLSRVWRSQDPASRTLARAIVLGFLAAGLNTLYWQVWGQAAIKAGFTDVSGVRLIGSYVDIAVKTAGAYAVYLHLAAWRMSLPEAERNKWSVLGMAFYPRSTGFLARALNGLYGERK